MTAFTGGWFSESNNQLIRMAHSKRYPKGSQWQDFDFIISGSGDYISMELFKSSSIYPVTRFKRSTDFKK